MRILILLVDDHAMWRQALRLLIERDEDFLVVGEAGDGAEAVDFARRAAVDVVCMDVCMPAMNGVEATRRLKALFPEVRIIALSAGGDHADVRDMLTAGARAYVSKTEGWAELHQAIRATLAGRVYFSPVAMEAVSGLLTGEPAVDRVSERLGRRERQVLQLVAEGHSSADIAVRLCISPSTVEVHRRNIMRKLDLHNVADLTRYCIRCGLIQP